MVEIYREPELETMIYESGEIEEWKKEVEKLGLNGQQKMIQRDNNPSVYILMNQSLKAIFSILCPSTVEYKNYDKSTIPLEVLREIALCEKEGYFAKIYIWWDDVQLDPIVVGKVTTDYSSPLHIIARWGDEVLPFEELKVKAQNRYLETIQQEHKELESQLVRLSREVVEGKGFGFEFSKPSISLW